jgi:hypothetical protein
VPRMLKRLFNFSSSLALTSTMTVACICAFASPASATTSQIGLQHIDRMADVPQPLQIIDYKQLALDFNEKVFDFNAKGDHWPLIWWDYAGDNFDQPVVGVYTAVGDVRQGPDVNGGRFHEAVTTMGAVLGATLVGIDKRNDRGLNYVAMMKNYFNSETGWNIVQNNTNPDSGSKGGGYARDWWYDVFPNVLFYGIYDLYPREKDFDQIARSIADQFYEADLILKGNYNVSFFDYKAMLPTTNWICAQPDVAAGHAWVLYGAYKKFGDAKYLAGAKSAMNALSSNKTNPSYEVLMPFGALMAARLNAEQASHYDVKKMIEWSIDGTAVCREGWGTVVGRWNGYDVSGIVGSTVDHGGYGFLMNTYDMAWPLVPVVRYDSRYANAIGKYMLNAANASRFFYPQYLPAKHQTVPHLADVTKGVIGYEGLIQRTSHPEYEATTIAPVAQGDGPKWEKGNPDVSQFSVYGSAHVGIFGGLIQTTDVEGILQLDLLKTDFFKDKAFPTYLVYNPHSQSKTVVVKAPNQKSKFDVYDTLSRKFIARNVSKSVKIVLGSKNSGVLVFTPVNGVLSSDQRRTLVNGVVIDYGI